MIQMVNFMLCILPQLEKNFNCQFKTLLDICCLYLCRNLSSHVVLLGLQITVSCPDPYWWPRSDSSLSTYVTKGWPKQKSFGEMWQMEARRTPPWGGQLFSFEPFGENLTVARNETNERKAEPRRTPKEIMLRHRWSSRILFPYPLEAPVIWANKSQHFSCANLLPPQLKHQKRIGTSKRKAISLSNTTLYKNFLSIVPLKFYLQYHVLEQ